MDVALEYQSLYNMKEELDNYSDNSFLKKYEWTIVLFWYIYWREGKYGKTIDIYVLVGRIVFQLYPVYL